MHAFLTRLIRRPWMAFGLIIALTVPAVLWGRGIPVHGDMEALFPDKAPNIVRARAARAALGARTELRILISAGGADQNRRLAQDLGERLAAHTGQIDRVELRRDLEYFKDQALLYLELDEVQEMATKVDNAIKDAVREELALDDDFGLDEPNEAAKADGAAPSELPKKLDIDARLADQGLSEWSESSDGSVLALKAFPTTKPADTTATRALMAMVETEIAALRADQPGHDFEIALEGDYAHITGAVNQLNQEIGMTTTAALAIIAVLLALWFRRITAVLLVLIPLAVGLAWTMALARVTVGHLNIITAFIFAILLGLGIDFAVHATARIEEELADGIPPEEAIPNALLSLGRAMAAAVITTVATFASLTVMNFKGFSQFGLLAAIGVVACFSAVYLTLPVLYGLISRVSRRGIGRTLGAATAVMPSVPASVPTTRRPALGWSLLLIVMVLAGGMATFMPELTLVADTRQLRSSTPRAASTIKSAYANRPHRRSANPALVLTEDIDAAERVHIYLDGLAETDSRIQEVLSIHSFVPAEQVKKRALIAEMKRKIDNKYGALDGAAKEDADALKPYLTPETVQPEHLPQWVRRTFTDEAGVLGRFVLIEAKGSKSEARTVLSLQALFGTIDVLQPNGSIHTYHSTASWYMLADTYETVRREGPWAVGLAALVVLLLLGLDLRRVRDVTSAFLPLVFGFIMLLGGIVAFDLTLNLFNIVILPAIFGVGVDTTIHLVHRLREENGDLGRVLRTTGKAAGLSALTTTIGFGSLGLVSSEGLRSIGWVAALGISAIYISSLISISAFVHIGWLRAGRPAGR